VGELSSPARFAVETIESMTKRFSAGCGLAYYRLISAAVLLAIVAGCAEKMASGQSVDAAKAKALREELMKDE
jgi:hypothetical protein